MLKLFVPPAQRLCLGAPWLGAAAVAAACGAAGYEPYEEVAGAARGAAAPRARCLSRRSIHDVYELVEPERPLGVGSFGVVFPGVHRDTGEIFAVKHYPAAAFGSPEETAPGSA